MIRGQSHMDLSDPSAEEIARIRSCHSTASVIGSSSRHHTCTPPPLSIVAVGIG